jgi:hypothetical protein
MKKSFLVLILLNILISNNIFSKGRKPDVNGGYKECTVYSYMYKDGKIDPKTKNKEFSYKYDDKGFIIVNTLFKSDGSLFGMSTFKFDNNGNIIEEIIYDEKGTVFYIKAYNNKFDNNGNIIEEIIYKDRIFNFWQTWMNKYDDKGSIIEEIRFNKNDSVIYWCIYQNKYDNRENLIADVIKTKVDHNNNCIMEKHDYKYDEKGNIIEEYWFKGYGNKNFSTQDKKENINECLFEDVECSFESIVTTKYDNFGNPIERIIYLELDQPNNFIEYIYSK